MYAVMQKHISNTTYPSSTYCEGITDDTLKSFKNILLKYNFILTCCLLSIISLAFAIDIVSVTKVTVRKLEKKIEPSSRLDNDDDETEKPSYCMEGHRCQQFMSCLGLHTL